MRPIRRAKTLRVVARSCWQKQTSAAGDVGALDEDDHAWLSLALSRALEKNRTLKKLVLGEYQILGERWQQLLKTAANIPAFFRTRGLGCDR